MSEENNKSKNSTEKTTYVKFGREVPTPSNSLKSKTPTPPKDKK
jgi:hypothetical protein